MFDTSAHLKREKMETVKEEEKKPMCDQISFLGHATM